MGRSIFAWRLDLQGDKRIVTQQKTRISKLVNPLLLKFGGFTKTDKERAITLGSRFLQIGILLSKCPKLFGEDTEAPNNSDEEITLLYKLERALYKQKQFPLPAKNPNMANLADDEPKYMFSEMYRRTKPVRKAAKLARKLAKQLEHDKFKSDASEGEEEEEDNHTTMQIEDAEGNTRAFTRHATQDQHGTGAMTRPIAKINKPEEELEGDHRAVSPTDMDTGDIEEPNADLHSAESDGDESPAEDTLSDGEAHETVDEDTEETDGRDAKHERKRSKSSAGQPDDDDGSSSNDSDSDSEQDSDSQSGDSDPEKDSSDEEHGEAGDGEDDDDDDDDDVDDKDNDGEPDRDAKEYVSKDTYTFTGPKKTKSKYVAPNQRSGSTPLYTRLIGKHAMISMSNKGQMLQLAFSHLIQCQDTSGNTRRWDHIQAFHGLRKKGSTVQLRPNMTDMMNFDNFLARLNFKSSELTVNDMHKMRTERACCSLLHEKIVDVCEEACQRWILSGQAQLPKIRKKTFSSDPAKAARQRSDEMRRQPTETDVNALITGELNEIINAVATAPRACEGMPTMQYLENIIKQSTNDDKIQKAHAVKRLLCSEIGDIKPYFSDRQVDGVEQLRGNQPPPPQNYTYKHTCS